jgi:hypothetical protein
MYVWLQWQLVTAIYDEVKCLILCERDSQGYDWTHSCHAQFVLAGTDTRLPSISFLWRPLCNLLEVTMSFVSWLSHWRLVYLARQLSGSLTTHCWSVHLTNISLAVLRCDFDYTDDCSYKKACSEEYLLRASNTWEVNLWKICFCFCLSRGILKTVSWCIDVLQA